MEKQTATRARVLDTRNIDMHFVFFKISQPGYPEHYVIETKESLIDYLGDMEGDEEERIVVTPTYMSVKEYNALPEFEGF